MPITVGYDPAGLLGQSAFTAGEAPVADELLKNQQENQRLLEQQQFQYGFQQKLRQNQYQQQDYLQNQRLSNANQQQQNRFQQQNVVQNQANVNHLHFLDQQNQQKVQAGQAMWDNRQNAIRTQAQGDIDSIEKSMPNEFLPAEKQSPANAVGMPNILNPADPGDQQRIQDNQNALQQKYAQLYGVKPRPYVPPPPKNPDVEEQNFAKRDPVTGKMYIGQEQINAPPGSLPERWSVTHHGGQWVADTEHAEAGIAGGQTLIDHPAWQAATAKHADDVKAWDAQNKINLDEQKQYAAEFKDHRSEYFKMAQKQNEDLPISQKQDPNKLWHDAEAAAANSMKADFPNGKPPMIDPSTRPQHPDISNFILRAGAQGTPAGAPAAGPQQNQAPAFPSAIQGPGGLPGGPQGGLPQIGGPNANGPNAPNPVPVPQSPAPGGAPAGPGPAPGGPGPSPAPVPVPQPGPVPAQGPQGAQLLPSSRGPAAQALEEGHAESTSEKQAAHNTFNKPITPDPGQKDFANGAWYIVQPKAGGPAVKVQYKGGKFYEVGEK